VEQARLQMIFQRRHIATYIGLPQAQITPRSRKASSFYGAREAAQQHKSVHYSPQFMQFQHESYT
jgi:hypothetical protein